MAIAYYNNASMEWEVLDMETDEVLDTFEDFFAAIERCYPRHVVYHGSIYLALHRLTRPLPQMRIVLTCIHWHRRQSSHMIY